MGREGLGGGEGVGLRRRGCRDAVGLRFVLWLMIISGHEMGFYGTCRRTAGAVGDWSCSRAPAMTTTSVTDLILILDSLDTILPLNASNGCKSEQ
jgi:hypothetical protein